MKVVESGVIGVELLETRKRSGGSSTVQRLYRCANGWSVAAKRGGALVLSERDSWEIVVLDDRGLATGNSVGWVSDETLLLAVRRLAAWDFEAAA